MHISLRLVPGESLPKDQLVEIAQACAAEFKYDQNPLLELSIATLPGVVDGNGHGVV